MFDCGRTLNSIVDETIPYAEGIEVKEHSFDRTVRNCLVLLVEVVVEHGTVVPSVGLRPQIEGSRLYLAIKLGQIIEECLNRVIRSYGGKFRGVDCAGVDHRPASESSWRGKRGRVWRVGIS